VDLQASAVAANRVQLSNLFMNELTSERVVPIISAGVYWLIWGATLSGFSSLPTRAEEEFGRVLFHWN
jgi:hypothetical protein